MVDVKLSECNYFIRILSDSDHEQPLHGSSQLRGSSDGCISLERKLLSYNQRCRIYPRARTTVRGKFSEKTFASRKDFTVFPTNLGLFIYAIDKILHLTSFIFIKFRKHHPFLIVSVLSTFV